MIPVYLRGVGLWTPGFRDALSWLDQKMDPAADAPGAALLEGALRRRATPLTRMAVEVFEQATTQARCDPAKLPVVWANAHGEHTPAIKLLEMMERGEGKASPTHFHNSVHNTAGGYASIATGNTVASSTLTGGTELVGSALFEARCVLETSASEVAVVLADEALQPPFDRADTATPLALAFVLSRTATRALAALGPLRRCAAAPLRDHERFGHLHVGAALPLLEGALRGDTGRFALELGSGRPGPIWCVDLRPVSGAG